MRGRSAREYGQPVDNRENRYAMATEQRVVCPTCGQRVRLDGDTVMLHVDRNGFGCDHVGQRLSWRPRYNRRWDLTNDRDGRGRQRGPDIVL